MPSASSGQSTEEMVLFSQQNAKVDAEKNILAAAQKDATFVKQNTNNFMIPSLSPSVSSNANIFSPANNSPNSNFIERKFSGTKKIINKALRSKSKSFTQDSMLSGDTTPTTVPAEENQQLPYFYSENNIMSNNNTKPICSASSVYHFASSSAATRVGESSCYGGGEQQPPSGMLSSSSSTAALQGKTDVVDRQKMMR